MGNEYIDLPFLGDPISSDELALPKAIEFVIAISNANYCELLGCKRLQNGDEVIVFETQPEVGQRSKNDIRYKERLGVHFDKEDGFIPWVYALRDDFPLVSHLNSRPFEKPRCLCLYETSYEELKLSWRGILYLERIREWLSLTAQGKLHQSDQPLEPFILNLEGSLILPNEYDEAQGLFVYCMSNHNNLVVLRAFKEAQPWVNKVLEHKFVLMRLKVEPQLHGVLRKTPENLFDLHQMLAELGSDFIEEFLKPSLESYTGKQKYHDHKPVIVITIPKQRSKEDKNPVNERISFISSKTIKEIGIACRLWSEEAGMFAEIIPRETFQENEVTSIEIGALATYDMFDKSAAANFNDVSFDEMNLKLALIGAGALGSQVFMNLTRMGYGKWIIIDDDIMFPHNLARHELSNLFTGMSKSLSMASVANDLIDDHDNSKALHENYVRPANPKKLETELGSIDVILDISTSISVARKLAHNNTIKGRRISLFLNPTGTDMVMLAESHDRSIRLDCLEAQYYRFLLYQEELHLHLRSNKTTIRYSTSCRDISSRIGQDNVATLSGIAAKAIRNINMKEVGIISVWQVMDTGEVKFHEAIPESTMSYKTGDWIVILDDIIIKKIVQVREGKLPNETGGVLIGIHDMERKITYVVETILSPEDSLEYPNAYYRGIKGLEERLIEISEVTADNLCYVGEWHSHPKGANVLPSDDDKILFRWIQEHMNNIGLPPLMIIAGDQVNFGIYTEVI